MSQIGYLSRVVRGMHYRKLVGTLDHLHHTTGRSRAWLFCDLVQCFLRYGAGYHDYLIFEFPTMDHRHRRTYVTRVRHKRIIDALNDQSSTEVIHRKDLFAKRFRAYLRREVVDLDEISFDDFDAFMSRHAEVFAKPCDLDNGRGVEKLRRDDFASTRQLWDQLRRKNQRLVEERIMQHPDLDRMYPHAVNCMRIVTIVVDGVPEVVYGVLKTGRGGSYLDNMGFGENMGHGGISAPIDLETGRLKGVGHSFGLEVYDKHPDTDVAYIGFQIPLFDQAVELVKRAALEVPQVRYVGWDVFMSADGPGIIEGNDFPDYKFWQLPEHTPERVGLWPYFQQRVAGL